MDPFGGAPEPPLPLEPPPDLSTTAFGRAMAWAGGSQFGLQLIQLPVTIVLSRLLVPRDFGLMAMILVVSQFLTVFVDAGLGAALVARRDLDPRHIATAFWMNLAVGVGLAAVVAAASPGIAALYDQPRLTLLTIAIAANFIVGSLGIVPLALLQREMEFRRIGIMQNAAAAVGGAAAIVAAVAGAGVWSLVIDILVASFVQTTAVTRGWRWRPGGGVDRQAARDLWSFGANQTGFQAVNYWSRNADNLLVGRFRGPRELGIYARAYQLMLLPLSQAGFVVNYVLYPALARIQHDHARLRRAYLRTVGVTALLAFPVTVGMFVIAPDLIRVMFGEKWAAVAPILRILCVAGLFQSISTSTGIIYQTQGRTDWLFRWGLLSSVIIVAGFAVGISWGAKGVAVAYAGLEAPLTYFSFSIPGRLIGMTVADVVKAVWAPLGCALVMGVVVWLVRSGMPGSWSVYWRFSIDVAVGAVIYLGSIHVAKLSSYTELRNLLKRS
jgi:O-antigen/teichoic acid export membrane protein